MHLNLTFDTPEENIACDEALLERSENSTHHEILRFWEPQQYFVVLGVASKLCEINIDYCESMKIPIIRRCSGGGIVLQGPGCLNYTLILDTLRAESLKNIVSTNRTILKKHQQCLEQCGLNNIRYDGISDLSLDSKKFSGNAQRRKRRFLLFHGTFLLNFNITMIEKTLLIPHAQPTYRKHRSHNDFLTNIYLSSSQIRSALQQSWSSTDTLKSIPYNLIQQLISEKYALDQWNRRT